MLQRTRVYSQEGATRQRVGVRRDKLEIILERLGYNEAWANESMLFSKLASNRDEAKPRGPWNNHTLTTLCCPRSTQYLPKNLAFP